MYQNDLLGVASVIRPYGGKLANIWKLGKTFISTLNIPESGYGWGYTRPLYHSHWSLASCHLLACKNVRKLVNFYQRHYGVGPTTSHKDIIPIIKSFNI